MDDYNNSREAVDNGRKNGEGGADISATRPLTLRQEFLPRPEGSIFGGRYLYKNIDTSEDDRHIYLVEVISRTIESDLKICPNIACGAIFHPGPEILERFCTDCGTELNTGKPTLILKEMRLPPGENLLKSINKRLAHGSIRAPLSAFEEKIGPEMRFSYVMPSVQKFPDGKDQHSINTHQMIVWGLSLARGLDYLHKNGVHFGGKIKPCHLGIDGGKAVWAGFENVSHEEAVESEDRQKDAYSLAKMVSSWINSNDASQSMSGHDHLNDDIDDELKNPIFTLDAAFLALKFQEMLADTNASKKFMIHSASLAHPGLIRQTNEDSLLAIEVNKNNNSTGSSVGVFVIADGMGGHAEGEVASGQIVDIFSQAAFKDLLTELLNGEEINISEWLISTIERANHKVLELNEAAGTDMGSTVVAAVLKSDIAFIAHVGDSRAYLLNQAGIQQLTTDHSLVEKMVASKEITAEEARRHPQRNVIYQTIGVKADIQPEVLRQSLKAGEYLLLCSDGLSGMLNDEEIHGIVLSAQSSQSACVALVNAANEAGGEDNISVILVELCVVS